jgi:hypothetical protein
MRFKQEFAEARRRFDLLSLYGKFEQIVIFVLTVLIAIFVIFAVFQIGDVANLSMSFGFVQVRAVAGCGALPCGVADWR